MSYLSLPSQTNIRHPVHCSAQKIRHEPMNKNMHNSFPLTVIKIRVLRKYHRPGPRLLTCQISTKNARAPVITASLRSCATTSINHTQIPSMPVSPKTSWTFRVMPLSLRRDFTNMQAWLITIGYSLKTVHHV